MSDTHHDALHITNNATIGGTLAVTGAATFTGAVTVGGAFTLTGAISLAAGFTVATNNKAYFRDTGTYIHSSADGQLDIVSDGEVQIDGGNIDINAGAGKTVDISIADQTTDDTAGGAASHSAGKGKGTGTGGAFGITAGAGGATGAGGAANITGGAGGTTSGNAGGVNISGGTPVEGAGGTITITGTDGVGTNQNGGDVTLTAGAKTGSGTAGQIKGQSNFLIDTDKKIQFRDSAISISSTADGQMDLDADVEIEATAPTIHLVASSKVDIDGAVEMSDDLDVVGIINAEAVSVSAMNWEDDFLEPANALASTVFSKAFWTGGGTSGTQAIVAAFNGLMRLSTTATGSRTSTLAFSNAGVFDNDLSWAIEFRIKTDALTNRKIFAGMRVDANDQVGFLFDTAVNAANIYLSTINNGAAEVQEDTGIDLTAGDYFTFYIEVAADDTFTIAINGTDVIPAHTGTIRDGAFVPYFYIDNKDQAQENLLDIDYVKIWQNRS